MTRPIVRSVGSLSRRGVIFVRLRGVAFVFSNSYFRVRGQRLCPFSFRGLGRVFVGLLRVGHFRALGVLFPGLVCEDRIPIGRVVVRYSQVQFRSVNDRLGKRPI